MSYERPQLRYVEALPVQTEKEVIVVLRDPDRLFDKPLAAPLGAFFILSLFDGRRTLADVQAEVTRQAGQMIPLENLESLARQLDEYYLLANERSLIRLEELQREYARLKVRPAVHAGEAYPGEADKLIELLDEYFARAGRGNGDRNATAPAGLVVPHIDVREGGGCMARAYREIVDRPPPALYIILGVAHRPTANLYTLGEKDFDTPLGPARVHREAAARLKALYGEDRLAGEYAHRFEHSVEFQAVFLKYLHRSDGHEFSILPILCGPIEDELRENGDSPGERPDVREFCEAVAKLREEFGPRVCIVASVDLSHVGPKFGQEQPVNDLNAGIVESADKRMLEAVVGRDCEAFYDHFRPDANARNVDAVSAVYTMLKILGPGRGEVLQYRQYRERETESMVSYASAALY